jgi:hypothetical protein
MIKVGDRVKFLNDVGGGIVTAFIGKNRAKVKNEDGFEVPYPVSKLLRVDDPALNKPDRTAEGRESPSVSTPSLPKKKKTKGKIIKGKDSPDFYFCLVPDDVRNILSGEIGLYLVNDSNFTLLYRFSHLKEGEYETIQRGLVHPNSKKELEVIDQSEFSDLPEYGFQLIFFRNGEEELQLPITKTFKVNPVKFYKEKSFLPNSFFKTDALIYQISANILNTEIDKLTDEDFRKVIRLKEKSEPAPAVQKSRPPEIVEVDLHIHELVDNAEGLKNREIIEIQLEKVEREMRQAIQFRAKRIVFIHGVGQGVLKQEVARLLKSQFPKYEFHDASFKEYGYGATMVILRRG